MNVIPERIIFDSQGITVYLPEFFKEWKVFQTKLVEKIKTRILCSTIPPTHKKIILFMRLCGKMW